MRFVAYKNKGNADPRSAAMGVLLGEQVAPLAALDAFYADIDSYRRQAAQEASPSLALSDLELAVPVPLSAKVICVAINYRKHGAEANLPTPTFPNLFARWTAELVADGTPVPVPVAEPDGLDWEVELAAIVGATLTDVDLATAQAGIFGYTVANDISGRAAQLQSATLSTGQWGLGKNVEKSGAVGSLITTADAVDERALALKTVVDGETMQSGSTADMVFSAADIIAFASRHITLRPGDLIMTGTPDGVGLGRNPRIYMKPGSRVTASIAGICSITNPIVDASHRG